MRLSGLRLAMAGSLLVVWFLSFSPLWAITVDDQLWSEIKTEVQLLNEDNTILKEQLETQRSDFELTVTAHKELRDELLTEVNDWKSSSAKLKKKVEILEIINILEGVVFLVFFGYTSLK